MRNRWLVRIAVVAAVGVAGVVVWRQAQTPAPPHYVTALVTIGDVTRAVIASGSVNPVTTIQVGSYVSGVIQDLRCDYNTRVKKGQLCARIDPRPYQTIADQDRASLATARAQLAKDETSRDYAKLTYDRTVDLRAQNVASQDAVDAAKSTYAQAAAQAELDKSTIAQRQSALDAAELNVSYTNIVSPVDGTVVARNVTMGQTVAASFQTPTLFLIATDLTSMQVDANVSESDIGGMRAGAAATFTVEAFPNRTFGGSVTQVRQAPQTVQNVVTYDVVISVANPDLLLKPGMTATAHIVVDKREHVLRVPDQALRFLPNATPSATDVSNAGRTRRSAGSTVWILRDGTPAAVPVVLGLDDDTFTEIVRGDLKAGDAVIVGEQAGGAAATQGRPPVLRP